MASPLFALTCVTALPTRLHKIGFSATFFLVREVRTSQLAEVTVVARQVCYVDTCVGFVRGVSVGRLVAVGTL